MQLFRPLARSVAFAALVGTSSAAAAQSTPSFPPMRVSVDLHEVAVRDILGWIADATGANVVLSADVGGTVTLRLDDVNVAVVFREVLVAAGLGWCAVGETIQVGSACR